MIYINYCKVVDLLKLFGEINVSMYEYVFLYY